MHDETSLRSFGAFIVRLQQGGNLTREEAREAFDRIWTQEQPPIGQGVFLEALRAKGPTADEIAGFIDSFEAAWFRHNPGKVAAPAPHLMVCGIGSDSLKSVNVSSGAAIIAAACGLHVHKVCAPGMTGVSGSADVFAIAGIDPHAPHEAALRACREGGLGVTSVVGASSLPVGHVPVLGNLRCATVLHIGGPMSRYAEDELHKVVGVPAPPLGRMVAEGAKRAGFTTADAPCGTADGLGGRFMDEYSNAGPTHVTRLHADGSITETTVQPEDAGLKRVHYDQIAAESTREGNVERMLGVLEGRHEDGPILDLLALNAAAMLEQMGKVADLAAGVEAARQAVASGAASDLLARTRTLQNPG